MFNHKLKLENKRDALVKELIWPQAENRVLFRAHRQIAHLYLDSTATILFRRYRYPTQKRTFHQLRRYPTAHKSNEEHEQKVHCFDGMLGALCQTRTRGKCNQTYVNVAFMASPFRTVGFWATPAFFHVLSRRHFRFFCRT